MQPNQVQPVIKKARLVRDETDNELGIVETLTDLTKIKTIKAREASVKQELEKRYALPAAVGGYPVANPKLH